LQAIVRYGIFISTNDEEFFQAVIVPGKIANLARLTKAFYAYPKRKQ
jgi:hypothetical protein